MRMLARVTVEVEKGNEAISSGNMGKVITTFMERAKPEAAYFTSYQCKRTGFFVVDLKDSSQLPPLLRGFLPQAECRYRVHAGDEFRRAQGGSGRLRFAEIASGRSGLPRSPVTIRARSRWETPSLLKGPTNLSRMTGSRVESDW